MPAGGIFALLDDDVLEQVLILAGPAATANLGLASMGLMVRILTPSSTCVSTAAMAANSLWRAFAVARWGHTVTLEGDEAIVDDRSNTYARWYVYYRRRCSTWSIPSPPSPLGLVQEMYASDPYKLLTSCILCSRTSGGELIRNVVGCFLDKYPTPTHVLEGDLDVMAEQLHPLGLNRERTMKRFAAGFLKASWADVTDLHGCGAFARSSHAVFCLGNWKGVLRDKTADRNVRAYAGFCRRYLAEEGDCDAVAEEDEERAARAKIEQDRKQKRRKPPKLRRALPPKRPRRFPRRGKGGHGERCFNWMRNK